MKIKKQKILFCDGNKGVFALAPDVSKKAELLNWITNKKFNDNEHQNYRLTRHTRKRNKLYSFQHPIYDTEVILKVSQIDKQYKLLRRFNLHISTLLKDYNYRAFQGACLLKTNNIACPSPIAYWTESQNILIKKSYYLYEKVQAEYTVYSFIQKLITLNGPDLNEIIAHLAERIINFIRAIHTAGFRQGDPHPGNFLISIPNKDLAHLTVEDIKQAHLYVVDLDKFSKSKQLGKNIIRFFDLKCLKRCTLHNYNQEAMLKIYLQDEYSKAWNSILNFWIRGGFNPVKQLIKKNKPY